MAMFPHVYLVLWLSFSLGFIAQICSSFQSIAALVSSTCSSSLKEKHELLGRPSCTPSSSRPRTKFTDLGLLSTKSKQATDITTTCTGTDLHQTSKVSSLYLDDTNKLQPSNLCEKFFLYTTEVQQYCENPSIRKDIQFPTVVSYTQLIKQMSRSTMPDKQEKAIELLQELKEAYQTKTAVSLKPDVYLYSAVITLLGYSESFQWAQRAEQILEEMPCAPDIFCMAPILNGYIKVDNYSNAVRFLLKIKDEKDENSDLMIDAFVYGSLFIAMAQMGAYRLNRGEKETHIQLAETAFASYLEQALLLKKNNFRIFSSMMNIYQSFMGPRGAPKMEEVLRQMSETHDKILAHNKQHQVTDSLKPGMGIFQKVMRAYIQLAEIDSKYVKDVIRLLREMEDCAAKGDLEMSPDPGMYHQIISFLSVHSDGQEEVLLEIFENLCKSIAPGEPKPGPRVYTMVLNVMESSRNRKWVRRATRAWNKCGTVEANRNVNHFAGEQETSDDDRSTTRRTNNNKSGRTFRQSVLNAREEAKQGNLKKAVDILLDEPDIGLHGPVCITVLSQIAQTDSQPKLARKHVQLAEKLFEYYKQGLKKLPSGPKDETNGACLAVHNVMMNVYGRLAARDGGPAKAEEILRQLYKSYEKGLETRDAIQMALKPDIKTFQTLFSAYRRMASFKRTAATGEMVRLLKEMEDRTAKGETGVSPDMAFYVMIISRLADSRDTRDKNIATMVGFLENLCKQYKDSGNPLLRPDVGMFGAILNVMANSNKKEWAERAETILRELILEQKICQPNEYCYNLVLKAHLRSGNHEGAAKFIIEMQDGEKTSSNTSPPIDEPKYISVFTAIAKRADDIHLSPEEKEKNIQLAETLFETYKQRMPIMDLVEGKEGGCLAVYNSMMGVYSKLLVVEGGAAKAETILREMYKVHEEGVANNDKEKMALKPDGISFQILINGYARLADFDPNAVNDVIRLLKEMEYRSSQGEKNVRPDTGHYFQSIACLTKQQGHEEVALDFLENQRQLYEKTGDEKLKPSAQMYRTILNAMANSGKRHLARRTEEMLREMQNYYKPHDRCYQAVIKAHLSQGNFEGAINILKEMEEKTKFDFPVEFSYLSIFSTIAKSVDNEFPDKKRQRTPEFRKKNFQLAEELFEHYKERVPQDGLNEEGLLNKAAVYNSFMNICGKLVVRERGAAKAEVIFRQMYKDYEEGSKAKKPDEIMFQTLIDGYIRSSRFIPGALDDAIRLLREMEDRTRKGEKEVVPKKRQYIRVISALLNREPYQETMLELFENLCRSYGATGDAELKPTFREYESVLDSLDKFGKKELLERAKRIAKETKVATATELDTVLPAVAAEEGQVANLS